MPTNEEGEFELVLGNKQLLSVFFLIVLLLGVFFSMGYIVGRNTAPGGPQMAASRSGSGTLTVDPPTASTPALPDVTKPSPVGQTPDPAVVPPPRETAKPAPKPEPVKTEVAKAEPPKVEPPKRETPPPPPPVAAAQSLVKGNFYLQVAAVRDKDADILRDVLVKRGFSTATEAVPEKALVRVLVGPFKDSAAMNEAKEKLSDFRPIARKI
ncbi:MAG: SPOR domain-containing protein [Bryobacterales bacterium]|nr:SPOR domain-containing protein [Bryobacterales bacterium]